MIPPDLAEAIKPHAKKMGVSVENWAYFMLRQCLRALKDEQEQILTTLPEPKVLNWKRK